MPISGKPSSVPPSTSYWPGHVELGHPEALGAAPRESAVGEHDAVVRAGVQRAEADPVGALGAVGLIAELGLQGREAARDPTGPGGLGLAPASEGVGDDVGRNCCAEPSVTICSPRRTMSVSVIGRTHGLPLQRGSRFWPERR